ncbi:MAG: hypothetical protein K0S70_141 [Microbacterium sp.]|jgi:hypothetical protein|nr:hypothetical protein [Microbacterium sp.]
MSTRTTTRTTREVQRITRHLTTDDIVLQVRKGQSAAKPKRLICQREIVDGMALPLSTWIEVDRFTRDGEETYRAVNKVTLSGGVVRADPSSWNDYLNIIFRVDTAEALLRMAADIRDEFDEVEWDTITVGGQR